MNAENCANCSHYLQHYILIDGKLRHVYCGHCTRYKPRTKRPDTPVCQHYIPKAPDTEKYVTKEYLTKALLNHLLSMELLPEIMDDPIDEDVLYRK